MFPLHIKMLPTSAIDLERALNDALRQVAITSDQCVRVVDRSYPDLEEIAVILESATLKSEAARPPVLASNRERALITRAFLIRGRKFSAGPANIDFVLAASDVVLAQTRDEKGNVVLVLQSASSGKIEVVIARSNLEAAIAELARSEAGQHGVTIEKVKLDLVPHGSREVAAQVQFMARKLFFTATIRIKAKLEIDEQMTACLSGLTCTGEGTIGTLACGFLAPHLRKLDGRSFPLAALPLGEIKFRDVRFDLADSVKVTAEFGA